MFFGKSINRQKLGLVTASTLVASVAARGVTKLLQSSDDEEETEVMQEHQKLSPSFMDRLAKKPYLESFIEETEGTRPPAVPQTLRLMTVDLTAVREKGLGSSAECHASPNEFRHGVAAPKRVYVGSEIEGESSIDIAQKIWIRAFHQCYYNDSADKTKKLGIEIMEADTTSLNPAVLRRMHSLIRYDHGKYARRKGRQKLEIKAEEQTAEDLDSVDQQEAPWNQHAWIEEAILRIGGKVKFGEPMDAVKYRWWNRWRKSESLYRTTVYARKGAWWDLFSYVDPAGMDGAACSQEESSNWASEKPHAVIVNGSVLQQRLPKALRLLQQICKENDVPLYVLHDPRRWGENTHETLGDVLEDVRRTTKRRIVRNSLQYTAGRPFARGRRMGKLETEAKWNLRKAQRKANELLARSIVSKNQSIEDDWSRLDIEALSRKLAQHGLLQIQQNEGRIKVLSTGMLELTRSLSFSENEKLHENEAIERNNKATNEILGDTDLEASRLNS
ncbi:hypothetical protein FisN_19Lh009 [Fistulifera solaris]|uniref:Uncharacterized protein n=1 Tax=Fistulifera solaris TaxID=1519565 RepID=A0A1Z5JRE8_FISSO|nr:hypothetical protein FisN_19Lh009 [Fistulifera solaris]|eukprot:GAX16432.1 hypothetical protein FisN_19Lh009 [Fistulifera solaris]